jgi:uncharacterized protein
VRFGVTRTRGESEAVDGGVARTAAVVIGLNVVLQAITFGLARSGALQPATGIQLSLWLGVGFYAVAYLLVVARLRQAGMRPAWTRGGTATSGWVGLAVGLVTAAAVLCLGHGRSDPVIQLVVSEGTVPRIALAVGLFVLLGPWIEELLFRGLVAEALRYRGARVAIGVSSVLFALAHLRGELVYYSLMGALLGGLYWRRGLKASFAAHAAFNGSLVVVAVLGVLGPAHLLRSDGVTVEASPAWHLASAAAIGQAQVDLAASGPSGAGFVVHHDDLPGAGRVDVDELPLPHGFLVVPGTARPVDYPIGHGVRLALRDGNQQAELVAVAVGDRVWSVVLVSGGSRRASHDFERMLSTLTVPAV